MIELTVGFIGLLILAYILGRIHQAYKHKCLEIRADIALGQARASIDRDTVSMN